MDHTAYIQFVHKHSEVVDGFVYQVSPTYTAECEEVDRNQVTLDRAQCRALVYLQIRYEEANFLTT
jgi:hypothetical protein